VPELRALPTQTMENKYIAVAVAAALAADCLEVHATHEHVPEESYAADAIPTVSIATSGSLPVGLLPSGTGGGSVPGCNGAFEMHVL